MTKIGCHVSIAGGLEKAPARAADLGCECYQFFSRSPQGGTAAKLTEELLEKFQAANRLAGLENFYIHAPYYINLGSVNPKIRHNSGRIILDELERADTLGARFVITHLGSANGWEDESQALEKTIKILQEYLAKYQGKARLLLENSAGAGKILGDDFKELGTIIGLVGSENIAGICLDTQHSFASGWDWRDKKGFEKKLVDLDKKLQGAKICLLHVNDSLTELGSCKDRHAHLGEGLIGLTGFSLWTNYAVKNGLDLILETEHDKVRKDLEILKNLRG